MSFCQYCGARLAEAAAGVVAPAASPLAAMGPVAHASTNYQFGVAERTAERAKLVVIGQDGKPGREYELDGEQTDIGRGEGTILLANDPYVSERHARLHFREGKFFIRDLESVNGVYVRLRAPERLQHADLVLVGLEVLRFEVVSDAERGLGPAVERGTQLFGSPAAPRFARLCQRTVEGVTRDIYYPTREETVIGREVGDVVFTTDPFMSRRHAAIVRDPATSTFSLKDLGSSNGTYLAIRGERELIAGDHVRIGQHLFRLDFTAGSRAR
jgi:pSer/pThr/pTyr-binding forkhead associated (FHA) protein